VEEALMGSATSVAEVIEEILPTPLQAAMAFVASLGWMLLLQREALLQHFVGGDILPPATTHQINLQVSHVLGLSLVGQAVIILFWSIVGLGAYLIVWWVNNLIIGARNQVILRTAYTNKASRGINVLGPLLKIAFLVALVISVATIPYGLNAWLRLWQELLSGPFGWHGTALALGSVVGFATELYISFMLFQFTANRFRS
jgi:hypothetical protein